MTMNNKTTVPVAVAVPVAGLRTKGDAARD